MNRLELVEMRKSGRLLVGTEALSAMSQMRRFKTAKDMAAALRQHVMQKWMYQHHVMELSEGEETFGFEGTPEW